MANPRGLLLLLGSLIALGAGCGGASGGTDAAGRRLPGADGSPPYPSVSPNGQIMGEGNFATLMKHFQQGRSRIMPWAGYWWPYATDGISDAAATYDQANPGSGAAAWEVSNHGHGLPNLQDWFGHCNGWSAAAVLYEEPRAPATYGGVTFSVADQKAILSEVAMEVTADFFGTRSNGDSAGDPAFQDIAPDVFFLVFTNFLGNGLPLVIDRYTGSQVWNQPVAGYVTEPIRPEDYLGPAPGSPGVHRVMVTTQMWWLSDNVGGGHLTEPFAFQDGPSYDSRVLRYEVWLDAPPVFDAAGSLQSSGRVIVARSGNSAVGGAWRNTDLELVNSHPDYIWIPHAPSASTGFSNPRIDAGWVQARFGRRNP